MTIDEAIRRYVARKARVMLSRPHHYEAETWRNLIEMVQMTGVGSWDSVMEGQAESHEG